MPEKAPPPVPRTRYCETFGFDRHWRETRLRLLGLSADDHVLGEMLQTRVLHAHAARIVERFYDHLLSQGETRALLNGFDLERLKHTQTGYLRSFGVRFDELDYFEERMRVGLVHAWVQVPLSVYVAAHAFLVRHMLEQVEAHVADRALCHRLSEFVIKVAALDVGLAGEMYHQAQVRELEGSLEALMESQQRLQRRAATDELTGMLNRGALFEALRQAMDSARRKGQPLALIMADLDHFKAVNDSYGHRVGDRVLRDVGQRIKSGLRGFDVVGRYGGEEFMAILSGTPLETAALIAERVRRRVGEAPLNLAGLKLNVTLSQGVAELHADDTPERFIERADQTLYRAKAEGRNCVRLETELGDDHAAGR
ncbi:GGDEF domain-containing protein [Thiohalobacter sp.]|uniref:GGDEF domain-containing protein n=1 Tax=Thiohalobacter sp. TaxID=2025948 RepID=UPI002606C075|nr:diguanylate cyclase [Thiohalobacter sp.]